MSNQPAIQITQLTKRFRKLVAVDDITLTIPRNTTLGLLGPNGAGKSTTLKMLLGMMRPTSGSINVLGQSISDSAPKIKQRVGYVPESHQIYRWMTVQSALKFASACYETWNQALAEEFRDQFELPKTRRVAALSKGMLAKLSLLIALAHEPELLVLDEPLSGLDPIARDEFIEGVLTGICREDRTVLFSTHQLDEVNRLADSVAIMNAGKVLVHCPMEELLGTSRRVRAVLQDGRLPEVHPKNTIWQKLNRREWLLTIHPYSDEALDMIRDKNAVEKVEVEPLGLDDVFKDYIRGTVSC